MFAQLRNWLNPRSRTKRVPYTRRQVLRLEELERRELLSNGAGPGGAPTTSVAPPTGPTTPQFVVTGNPTLYLAPTPVSHTAPSSPASPAPTGPLVAPAGTTASSPAGPTAPLPDPTPTGSTPGIVPTDFVNESLSSSTLDQLLNLTFRTAQGTNIPLQYPSPDGLGYTPSRSKRRTVSIS